MQRRFKLMVLGAVVILLFSSCFALRGFRWSAHKIVRGGGKVVALLSLYPHGNPTFNTSRTDRVFILVVFPDDTDTGEADTDWRVVNPKVFDFNRNFGPRRTLVRDDDLENMILTQYCTEITADPATVVVFRTQGIVDDRGRIGKEALTKLGVKANATTNINSVENRIQFWSGGWDDDGDGVPESSDNADCTGVMGTTLPVRNN
jgi:hypothetical protein